MFMEENTRKNPWLGLESYREGEVLYGRDDDIRDLTQCVLNDADTLLYGKSGIGKSSILNAGIIPAARRNGYVPVLVRFSHKGEDTYLQQIHHATSHAATPALHIKEEVPCRDPQQESLYEFFHRHTFHTADGERVKLLVIFDQFEEIFTLQSDEGKKKRFFVELADLLNDIMPAHLQQSAAPQADTQQQTVVETGDDFDDLFSDIDLGTKSDMPNYVTDNDIHLVFTIREDFLSEFEYYSASIPSLKQNRYGLRPINEEQAAQIILRPMPGLITVEVARLIIEKVTGRTDFDLDGIPEIEVDSAVLSLYLNRLYEAKTGDTITSELVEQKGGEIIADFYLDAISDIRPATIEYLEDMLLNGQGRRDNITVFDAINDGGATEAELDLLCNKKKILRQFNYAGDLRVEYVHDILCPVVKAHKEERLMLKQQEEERIRQEEEKRKLLLEEKAKREKIEKEAEREQSRLRAEAVRTRKRNRRVLYIIGSFVLVLLLGIILYMWKYTWKHESYYAQFERVNGWPVGVGKELTSEEMSHLPLYYKLSHEGHLDYDTDVEICSSNKRLPRIPRIFCLEVCEMDSDSRAKEYLNLLSQIKSIHFEAGEGDRLNKEVIKGENDSVLYYVNYFYLETEGQVWAQFVSSQGQAMAVRGNGLDRIKMSWYVSEDDNDKRKGRVTSMMYYDALGVNQAGANGIYGYQMEYSEDGLTSSLYSLDKYGRPFDALYNVMITNRSEDETDIQYAHANSVPDSKLTPAIGPNGFWREVRRGNEKLLYQPGETEPSAKCYISTNKYGNTKQLKMEGKIPASQPAIIEYTYAEGTTGYRTSEKKLNADGSPFHSKDGIYMRKWGYDENGGLILEEHYSAQTKKPVYAHYIKKKANIVRDEVRNAKDLENPILIRVDSIFDKNYSSTFYGSDNKPVNFKKNEDKAPCHRFVVEKDGNMRTITYFHYDNESGKEIPQTVTIDDADGTVLSYYCKKEKVDDDGNIISYQLFDENMHIVKSMMFFYQNGQNTGRAVMGIEGKPVRCPKWEEEGFAYYKIYYIKDFVNNYASVSGVNEWEKPSIFYDGIDRSYKQVKYLDFKGWQMTDNKSSYYQIINPYKQFIFDVDDGITSVTIPYIHILDPHCPLYTYNNGNGLKDGDRIVRIGAWKWKQPESLLASEWRKLGKEQTEIVVLRPTENGYEQKTFKLKIDESELDLVEYHVLALTENELQILNNNL